MTAFEIILLVIGVIFMVGSFFMTEKLSAKEVSRIAELSNDEIKRILEKNLKDSKGRVEELIDEVIDDSMEIVEAALDKETNKKMLELGEYSDTVMESANKTHNEIMFLYGMLNDKHTEMTEFVGELQEKMKEMEALQQNTIRPIQLPKEKKVEPVSAIESLAMEEAPEQESVVEEKEEEKDLNSKILALHQKGMPNVKIAKELNIGLGEVQLVIGLYRGEGKA